MSKVPAKQAGYSGTPLVRKLGVRPNERLIALHAPAEYARWLAPLPENATIAERLPARPAFVHLFVRERRELVRRLTSLRKTLEETGVLWVSWPKKAARTDTDVTEDVIREVALPLGFVDVKVCAVDETWSGLKLVIRRELRRASA